MPDCHVMVCHCCDRSETRQIRAELAKYNGAKPRQRARLVQTSWEDVVTSLLLVSLEDKLVCAREGNDPVRAVVAMVSFGALLVLQ